MLPDTLSEPFPAKLVAVRESVDGGEILHIFDEVDIATAADFGREVAALPASGRVVIDLLGCRYLDSSALAVLIRAQKAFGTRLAVVVPPRGQIERVLRVTRLNEYLPIVDSLERAFGREPAPGATRVA